MTAPAYSSQHGREVTRRRILLGAAASLIYAPAIVWAGSLMPVRGLKVPSERPWAGFVERLRFFQMENALERGWEIVRDGQTFGSSSELEARRSVAYASAQGWLCVPAKNQTRTYGWCNPLRSS